MKILIIFIILISLGMSKLSFAGEESSVEDVEILKLRIRELELKKEILELEAKKNNNEVIEGAIKLNQAPTNQTSVYQTPAVTSPSNSYSGYTRGPRGGCYTFSKSGRKKYVDRSLCN